MKYVFLISFFLLAACQKELSFEGTNIPPVAQAGRDTTLPAGIDSVLLDGSASSDTDGTIIAFAWTQLSGPSPSLLSNAATAVAKAAQLTTGSYIFQLEVIDDKGAAGFDTIVVHVSTTTGPLPNHPPIANAGPDLNLTAIPSAITLDGSGSVDPGGTITGYLWEALQQGTTIQAANQPVTTATGLSTGSYSFRLTVTDDMGLTGSDTVAIHINFTNPNCNTANRPIVQAQLQAFGTLAVPRAGMKAAAVGNKILFIGGETYGGALSPVVDIYDWSTNTWSVYNLGVVANASTVATLGSKVFIAGGHDHWGSSTNAINIYDANTNAWSTAQLIYERTLAGAAAAGNKMIIAGGEFSSSSFPPFPSSDVDIFDQASNSWTTSHISQERSALKGLSANGKAYFFGGMSNESWPQEFYTTTDVYDPATGTWSQPAAFQLSEAKSYVGGIVVDNKFFLAGGLKGQSTTVSTVEIIDIITGLKTFDCLSREGAGIEVVQKGSEIVFFIRHPHYDFFDVFNTSTGQWSIVRLPFSLQGAAIISVNNEIFVAGGGASGQPFFQDQVWKLTW